MSKVRGAVGTEKRPPLIVVMGLGKGTEGPREETGALWSLVTLVAVKLCITLTASNIAILLSGPEKDGAIYCSEREGCSGTWLHYQFYCARFSALVLILFIFCLEIGIGPVVRISGDHRGSWYNNYIVRGTLFFFLGVLTGPDLDWIWYASWVQGVADMTKYYGGCLVLIQPCNFVLSLVPRGYPTSIKTQRPESTFWATVTLLACALCCVGLAANLYEMFGTHEGQSLAFASYGDVVGPGQETAQGRALYVYQQYAQRLSLTFFLPLLFAAELEVTAVLHALPELRYLVTKGPLYLLVGSVLLIADSEWPARDFVNYTGFAFLIMGCMYLGFPAVRIIHELYGDRLSPKTRFYPGLYTFFSVWGVVLGILTLVLLLWEAIVYDVVTLSWLELYLWYTFKLLGGVLALLATCVELELHWLFDLEVGGVPVHCDFLRNWVCRSFLYLLIACMCAESGGLARTGYVSLFDLDRAVMWTWVALSITYAVFFLHLVGSAILYRLYIANGAWFSKREGMDGLAVDESETQGLLAGFGSQSGGTGPDDVEAGWAAGAREGAKQRKGGAGSSAADGGKSGSTKKDAMKRFVLQPKGRLVITPIKFTEDPDATNASEVSPALAAAGSGAEAQGDETEGSDAAAKAAAAKAAAAAVKGQVASKFFVRCLLGEDGEGASKRVEPVKEPQVSSGSKKKAAKGASSTRSAKWPASENIPLVVSAEVARMGKSAAIEVQVWGEGPKKTAGWGGGGESGGGSNVSDLEIGEARVALDQLTLGVPGMVQLHAPHNPSVLRGTLELVISYEPAPNEDGGGGGGHRGRKAGGGGTASVAGDAGAAGGAYETAVDPNSGRKYWYNRATGHRTWSKPAEAGGARMAEEEQVLANANI